MAGLMSAGGLKQKHGIALAREVLAADGCANDG